MIKKHYGTLCSSLPSNYKKTVKRLQQLTDLAEEDMMLILSSTDDQLTDPVAVNQRILIYLFMNCQSYDQLLDVHRILEDLVSPSNHLSIHRFFEGKIYTHYPTANRFMHHQHSLIKKPLLFVCIIDVSLSKLICSNKQFIIKIV